MQGAREFFHQLNRDYLAVHKAKEDLFWDTYMAISDDHAGFARAEQEYKAFISDPDRLAATRRHLAELDARASAGEHDDLRRGLNGWLQLFECNIIDSDEAREHLARLIDMEAGLFARRRDLALTHVTAEGHEEPATLGILSTNLGTNPSESSRKSSHEALLGLEDWVLANGFLDIVRQRNRLARSLGYRDYFDYKVRKNERLSTEDLFAILDDFEVRTRDANRRALDDLACGKGSDALLPHNFRYMTSGDIRRQSDPYLPFGKALTRWVESFRRMGITYRGARMQLDLLERPGKYQNGFCHGPIPSYFDENGNWVAAQVNFTSEAKPDQVGSGSRAINTLFHEGGHAAHFANVTGNAPCFSQEFPPTSMAYAETQSMFCDSVLEDADWLKRYARDARGEAMPDELIRARIEANQPFAAFNERSILVVPYFERDLYQLSDEALTPERVKQLARDAEQRILGLPVSPRPLLAIPHLLNQESAASYHGYLLANMAVYQTRAWFLRTYGHITDNPEVGPALARHYWAPGNSVSHNDTLISLTGEGFSARYLADSCTRTVEAAWNDARRAIADAASRAYPDTAPATLDADIRIVHGSERIADNHDGDEAMCRNFERWIADRYPGMVH
ncbi:M3 family metallopeptidase [Paludibacterium paludis]|uniref:Peptidase n=1 Tax=Paludibacterium paludis TaxID=1225769 RepID=A0A918P600_9NEIS|nr:M3 family metallopeptidase [Paludibacterium paludis]GGY25482.1 peptidase [Paludibacterium paludis]